MHNSKKRVFFCQTIQDTVALNFLLPIRTISLTSKDTIFSYSKEHKLLDLDYSSKKAFVKNLENLLHQIPNFLYEEQIEQNSLLKKIESIKTSQITHLRKLIYFTKSSFNPFFMAALDDYTDIKTLKLIFYLYIIFTCTDDEENVLHDLKFFNFAYKVFHIQNNLFIIGPTMIDESFQTDEKRLVYIKNIKRYFSLNLHTYELLNMFNQRNIITKERFNTKAKSIKKVLHVAQNKFIDRLYKKSVLRELATHFIVQSKTKKPSKVDDCIHKNSTFYNTLTQIKNNQILRDLEALEWFNDLTFQNLSFETSNENLKNVVLRYLQKKLQAHGYILCSFDHYTEKLSLMETSATLREDFKNDLIISIAMMNKNKKDLHSSYTYDVIKDYTENKNPIKLIEDVSKYKYKLCRDDQQVKSLLSIPLVFDKRVFAVLHFISFEKYRFDEIDKRFLLKLSSALSKRYIENNLNSCIDQTVSLLEGLNKKIDHAYLKQKTDEVCENIAKAFSCDGVIIWFNKKEVFQTPREVNELSILSEINFLDEDEIKTDQNYTIGEYDKDSLIMNNSDKKDVVVISNIEEQCSDNKNDIFFMKYKEAFVKKEITSIMFVSIKNYEGKFSGAVMIYDKFYRNYNQLSRRMLKRISVYIGSILNTVTYAKYRAQQLDERNLHESAQYLNIINSRAKDLENRLQNFNLTDSFDKHKLFLNIEDIKDFTAFTRNYLFTIFKDGRFTVKKYDELLSKSIQSIKQNSEFIPIKKSINQVLAVNKSKMHASKHIGYKNYINHNIEIKIPSQYLHDVLGNLINNAIKYGKQGTHIKLTDQYSPPYFYNIYIENIGYRINEGEKEKIFEKGFRGYVTKSLLARKKEFEQSLSENKGVGLYLAKGIIKGGLGGNVLLYESTPIGKSEFNKNVFVIKIPYEKVRKVK
jgi:signal transduction histidine kinase